MMVNINNKITNTYNKKSNLYMLYFLFVYKNIKSI